MVAIARNRLGGAARLPLLIGLAFSVLGPLTLPSSLTARSLRLQRPITSRAEVASPIPPADPAQLRREFPHLLIDRSVRRPEHQRTGPGVVVGTPNAHWRPGDLLPPSVGSRERRDRALGMVAADPYLRGEVMGGRLRGGGVPDTQRVVVLRVDFLADTPGSRSTGDGRFDLRDSTDLIFDPPPHNRVYFERHMEALARYYDVTLRGTVVLEFDVFPAEKDSAYHLPDTLPYGPWIFSNNNPDVLQHAIDLVGDALSVADRTDESVDFDRYDHFVIFHAGSDFQGDVNRDTPWDIPSFNLFVTDPFVVQDSVAVNLVMVVPETVTQDEFLGALNGVVTHEFGHQLGFVDLYDVRNGLPVVGAYSLMDSGDNLFALVADPDNPGINLAVRGTLPSSLDPFHKTLWYPESVNLVDVGQVVAGDSALEVTLEAVALGNDVVSVPLNLSEYLLLENRHLDLNADSTVIIRQDPETGVILGPEPDSSAVGDTLGFLEYDWLIPGEGIVIWRVDFLGINAGLSLPGGGVNVLFNRPGVSVIEADGIRDIGTASTEFLGGPFDPFFVGGFDRLGPDTVPSSATADGTRTGVSIAVLDAIGPSMRVSVESTLQPTGWPVRVGAKPRDEQVLALDLGFGAPSIILPARDSGRGALLVELVPDGGGALIFADLADTLQYGLAGRSDFAGLAGASGAEAVVAAVAGGRLHLFDGQGQTRLLWPAIGDPDSDRLAVTATPVVLERTILVGCADGLIRRIQIDPGSPVVSEFPGPGGAVTALAAGRSAPEDAILVFSASRTGQLGAGALLADGSYNSLWSVRSDAAGAGTSGSAGLLAVPLGGVRPHLLAGWRDGSVEWRDPDGLLVPGWPARAGARLAGSPLVADLDRDGELETMAADELGRIHSWTFNGREDIGYPRSIWSEDQDFREPLTTSPRVFDVDGDGRAELLIHRPDGFVLAIDGDGEARPGWPLSVGAPAIHGPEWVPGSGKEPPRIVVGSLEGVTSAGVTVELVSAFRVPAASIAGLGFFPMPGLGPERSRFYPRDWVPEAQAAPAGLSELRFYPNPLRGGLVNIRVVVGGPATVRFDAYDLSGQRVAGTELSVQAGINGNQLAWDLASLSSGLYHVRARIDGAGWSEERFDRLAVLR